MSKKYIGESFDLTGDDGAARATVSLVGSHLQNVGIEIEDGYTELFFLLSPVGTRRMISALQAALDYLKQASQETAS